MFVTGGSLLLYLKMGMVVMGTHGTPLMQAEPTFLKKNIKITSLQSSSCHYFSHLLCQNSSDMVTSFCCQLALQFKYCSSVSRGILELANKKQPSPNPAALENANVIQYPIIIFFIKKRKNLIKILQNKNF